jgi:uncharacterized protein
MEDPRPQLQAALKEAMVNKDSRRRDVLRQTMSAIKQVEVDTQKELSAEDVVAVLQKEAKKRRESIEEMERVGRAELAQGEHYELGVIEEFLPRQLSEDEIRAEAQAVIAEVGAEGPKDTGKVMGPLMERVKGRADGKLVNKVVRDLLTG